MLNLNCMNALLKTIEEPPENTIIIIFAQNLRNIPKQYYQDVYNLDSSLWIVSYL